MRCGTRGVGLFALWVCCSDDLGCGFSCGFEGSGFDGACGVGVGCEFVEAVDCGDAGLGCDGLFADLCDLFEGFESGLEHG